MKSKKIVVPAMLIAISVVLSFIQLFQLPFGGSITPASMMPIVITAFLFGTKRGLLSAFAYSLLQMIIGFKTISAFFLPGESQMNIVSAICVCIMDYVLAYTVLGFGGIFKNKIRSNTISITLGTILALGLRYIVHIISGTIFFGAWAEWFFSQEGFYSIGTAIINNFSGTMLSVIYSVFYNGLYMIPEIIITAIATPFVYNMLKKSKAV